VNDGLLWRLPCFNSNLDEATLAGDAEKLVIECCHCDILFINVAERLPLINSPSAQPQPSLYERYRIMMSIRFCFGK